MSIHSIGVGVVVAAGIAVAGAVGYVVSMYNSLVQVKNNVEKAFKNIDVLLMQRHDELPKLIDTCKGYMKYEKELLEKIINLREGYAKAATPDEKTAIENDLGRQLLSLNARAEAYPELKANAGFLQIQGRVSGLESGIADRREFFNDSVNIYNIRIESFPDAILAKSLGYTKRAFLEVPEDKKEDVKMDFS